MTNGPVQSGDLFFFYGLLKQGAKGAPQHIDLDAGGEFLGPAKIEGELYDLGDYPGLTSGDGRVEGMLYRLDDVSLLPALDAFEGVVPRDPQASLYTRKQTPLISADRADIGQLVWVYWYNRSTEQAVHLPMGVWPLDKQSL